MTHRVFARHLKEVMVGLQCVGMLLCDVWSFSVVVSKTRVRSHFQHLPKFGGDFGKLAAIWSKAQLVSN